MTEKNSQQDDATPPLDTEEDANVRIEMIRDDLVPALRAVLAERLVRDPEEEIRRGHLLDEARSRVSRLPLVEHSDKQA